MDAQPIGDGVAATGQEPMAQDGGENRYPSTLEHLSHQKTFSFAAQCPGQVRPIECKATRNLLVLDGAWTGEVLEFFAKCGDATDQRIWNELQPVQLRLVNDGLEEGWFRRRVCPELEAARNGWVFLFRLNWKDLVNAEHGYVVGDTLKLELLTK